MNGRLRALVAAALLGVPFAVTLALVQGVGTTNVAESEAAHAPAPRGCEPSPEPPVAGAPPEPPEPPVAGAQPVRVALDAAPLLALAGRVLDARTREPLPKFQVALLPAAQQSLPFASLDRPVEGAVDHASLDGRFTVTARAAGPHRLVVWSAHGETACRDVTVGPDGGDEECTILVETGIRVRGVVVDHDGAPVADAWVAMDALELDRARGSHTAADGCFDLGVAQPGEYRVKVESAARPSLVREGVRLTLAQRDARLRLALPQGASVAGSVRPVESGRQVDVVFTHAPSGVQHRADVAADGRYELSRLTPGAHRVHVEHRQPSFRSYVARGLRGDAPEVVLVDGAHSALDVTDPVATMARVRVQVVGRRPAGLEVVAVRERPPLPARASGPFRVAVDATGCAALDGLVPGRWRLELHDGSATLHKSVVDLAPQEERQQRIDLR